MEMYENDYSLDRNSLSSSISLYFLLSAVTVLDLSMSTL